MSHYLPQAIMSYFVPRPKLEFKKPLEKRPMPAYSGIGQYMHRMKEYEETIPLPTVNPTPTEIKNARKLKQKMEV